MQTYEYKAVPAPTRPKRVKGVKGTAGRFAALLTETMNDQAVNGWEYLRSDSMPVEDKPGLLKSRVETYQTVLVFRRPVDVTPEPAMAGYIEDHSDEQAPQTTPEAAPESQTLQEEPAATQTTSWGEQNYRQDPPLRAPTNEQDSPFTEPQDDPHSTNR